MGEEFNLDAAIEGLLMEQNLDRKVKEKNNERVQKGVNTDLNVVA